MRSIPPRSGAYGVAHLALRTPFYVQNHDARSASIHGRVTTVDALRAWEHWSTGVVLFRSRAASHALLASSVVVSVWDESQMKVVPDGA